MIRFNVLQTIVFIIIGWCVNLLLVVENIGFLPWLDRSGAQSKSRENLKIKFEFSKY